MTIDEAIIYFENEIRLYRAAPGINGCEMTASWKRAIDACTIAVNAMKEKKNLCAGRRKGKE